MLFGVRFRSTVIEAESDLIACRSIGLNPVGARIVQTLEDSHGRVTAATPQPKGSDPEVSPQIHPPAPSANRVKIQPRALSSS
jgi:hypothetical protein